MRAARQREELLEAADEAVRHAELWTTYGAEGRVRSHVDGIGRALSEQGARIEASAAALGGANEVLGALALVLAIAAARAGFLGAAHEEALLLPFAVTFFLAYRPIRDLTDARLALARAGVAADSLAPLFASDPDAVAAPHALTTAGESRTWKLAPLELESLRLARGVLSDVSVRVAPGTVLAIVGATGSGKTTLLRTLLGLDASLAGAIRYGAPVTRVAPFRPELAPLRLGPAGRARPRRHAGRERRARASLHRSARRARGHRRRRAPRASGRRAPRRWWSCALGR